jgi:hypothetical protein
MGEGDLIPPRDKARIFSVLQAGTSFLRAESKFFALGERSTRGRVWCAALQIATLCLHLLAIAGPDVDTSGGFCAQVSGSFAS